MDETQGKIVFNGIRWRIEKHVNPRRPQQFNSIARATCITCQVDLKENTDGAAKTGYFCPNPMCAKHNQRIVIDGSSTDMRILAVNVWEGAVRQKESEKWLNLDQELVLIAADDEDDTDNQYWVNAKFFNTKRGKMLMVMVGKKDSTSKVHLFVKDGEDQITSDQVGDLNPKELFLGFKAYFSDGVIAQTNFEGGGKDDK